MPLAVFFSEKSPVLAESRPDSLKFNFPRNISHSIEYPVSHSTSTRCDTSQGKLCFDSNCELLRVAYFMWYALNESPMRLHCFSYLVTSEVLIKPAKHDGMELAGDFELQRDEHINSSRFTLTGLLTSSTHKAKERQPKRTRKNASLYLGRRLYLHVNSNCAFFNAGDLHSGGDAPKIKQPDVPEYIEFTGAIEFTNIECHPFYIIAVLMELVNHGTTTAIPLLGMPIPISEHTCLVQNGR